MASGHYRILLQLSLCGAKCNASHGSLITVFAGRLCFDVFGRYDWQPSRILRTDHWATGVHRTCCKQGPTSILLMGRITVCRMCCHSQAAYDAGVRVIEVTGDSNLVVKQV